ncbi:hypothetical protein CAPTEDRAFT_192445 [Capitella teleta]|uniref:Prospero domain-containing protein n=1 Tax=Capitella teleta TaxID=283909 RepID=R7VBW5_CAPTE|nr:hypothetical protein CAPTEDRAFT_192445 [Capitella teleta]|eukprot:ELU16333.1 hypothetical protein CAPTEDRAFT_192445 [Capitella teleta]
MSALVDNGRTAATNGHETPSVFDDDLANHEGQERSVAAGDANSLMHKSQVEPTLHRMEDILKDRYRMSAAQNADEAATDEYLLQSRKSAFSPPSRLKGALQLTKSPCHSPGLSAPRDFRLNNLNQDSDGPSPDVLRGILQGKDHPNSDAFTSLLRRERELEKRLCRGGEYEMNGGGGGGDSENDSMDFGSSAENAFSDESDGESQQNGAADRTSRLYDDEQNDEDSLSSNGEESLVAKRARVENIISNIHMSPSKISPDSGILSQGEVKRPSKRKQYIPQQHGGNEEPPSKVPHLEGETESPALQKQIRNMQSQFSALQQNYSRNFPVNNNNDNRNNNIPEDQTTSPFTTPTSTKYPQPHELIEMPRKSASLLEAMDMDPNQFMKEANRVIESRLPKQQSSPIAGNTPADLEHLAKILKTEITNSVGTLVDNIVSKFVAKQSKRRKSCSPVPPIKSHSPVKPKNTYVSTSSSTTTSTPSHRGSSPAQPKEKLVPENLSLNKPISPPTQPPPPMKTSPRFEFPHDFNAMLRPPRTKMTEKLCHPLFEAQMKAFAEMPRPHLPLFPPPYFPPGLHPGMPHLFAKEPEQTEAMPLLVNTPKKKRTKVTDTRLSPRAARALLQETIHGGGGHQHGSPQPEHPKGGPYRSHCSTPGELDHFSSPFHHHPPPLVPASLPTSVAIPNPGLQHSEVLAMYSHGEHPMFPDVSARMLRGPGAHSPSGSPSMGHTPGDMHMPVKEGNNDSFDSMHEQFTYEGHPIVSFSA